MDEPTTTIVLDEYELGNLIGLMLRAHDHDNGDWYCQVLRKLIESGIVLCEGRLLDNNFQDRINMDMLRDLFNVGQWRLMEGQNLIGFTKHGGEVE